MIIFYDCVSRLTNWEQQKNKTKKIELGKTTFLTILPLQILLTRDPANSCHPEGKGIEEMDNGDYTEND